MLVAVLDAARAEVPHRRAAGAGSTCWARAGSAASAIGRSAARTSRRTGADAAHRDVEAQLDLGDARAHDVLPAARLRRQEGAPVDPVLRLGIRAGVADHDRPQGRHATRCSRSRRRAASASRRASGSSSIPEGTRIQAGTRAKYKTGGARLAIDARRADHSGRAQRRLPVAEGRLRQAAGNGDDLVRQADLRPRARIRRR